MKYKRFIDIHLMFELGLPKKNSRTLEIGLAEFAKYENELNKYYFDYHFGGFCAEGFSVEFNKDGSLVSTDQIWIS
jgi:hypothetical protein